MHGRRPGRVQSSGTLCLLAPERPQVCARQQKCRWWPSACRHPPLPAAATAPARLPHTPVPVEACHPATSYALRKDKRTRAQTSARYMILVGRCHASPHSPPLACRSLHLLFPGSGGRRRSWATLPPSRRPCVLLMVLPGSLQRISLVALACREQHNRLACRRQGPWHRRRRQQNQPMRCSLPVSCWYAASAFRYPATAHLTSRNVGRHSRHGVCGAGEQEA